MTKFNANQYGKVAVLMGGDSGERVISLKSGAAVLQALQDKGVNAVGIDVDNKVFTQLEEQKVNRVFIALHGCRGEDGAIQGGLEMIGLPYTGSGLMASGICMNKFMTKKIWQSNNIPTPNFMYVSNQDSYKSIEKKLGSIFIVKPTHEGSSLGIFKISNEQDFKEAINNTNKYQGQLMAEQWIDGEEYTVGILSDAPLPVIKLQSPNEFYDFEAKYQSNDMQYILPCGLYQKLESRLQVHAMEAFNATDASGWGRVDVMMDKQQKLWFLEVNTVPGMTDHSLVPMAAASVGISFEELVIKILDTAI